MRRTVFGRDLFSPGQRRTVHAQPNRWHLALTNHRRDIGARGGNGSCIWQGRHCRQIGRHHGGNDLRSWRRHHTLGMPLTTLIDKCCHVGQRDEAQHQQAQLSPRGNGLFGAPMRVANNRNRFFASGRLKHKELNVVSGPQVHHLLPTGKRYLYSPCP